MYVHAPLMWGFPFEDMTDFQETLGFGRMLEALGGHVFYTLATPLPATALYREFRERLLFDGELYSTIIAPGRLADLSEVQHLIRRHTNIFPGFYHFADGRVHEKIAVGRAAQVTLGDIRISNLVEAPPERRLHEGRTGSAAGLLDDHAPAWSRLPRRRASNRRRIGRALRLQHRAVRARPGALRAGAGAGRACRPRFPITIAAARSALRRIGGRESGGVVRPQRAR